MRYDAVLLDAYGTLVELDRPFDRLSESLRRHLGADVRAADAERAFRAEMAHYAARCHVGVDAESLAALRAECATVILTELGIRADADAGVRVLAEALAFRTFSDVQPLLAGLAHAGLPVAVVSNWDQSLAGTLAALGLEFAAVVTCAEAGVRKPDPGIFLHTLDRLGAAPARALHIGDTPAADGTGARAAGIDVRIVDRTGEGRLRDTIGALTDVLELL